jgi:predicted ester cyclase
MIMPENEKATARNKASENGSTLPNGLLANGHRDLMPQDYSISLDRYHRGGTDRFLLNPPTERTQSLKGFEEDYIDIIDYIVRITTRIWEEGGIGRIYDYYRYNSRVHNDTGWRYGNDIIVADTVGTINAFPNFRGYAEEIIWAGNDEVGFYTSHRALMVAHNTGYSQYGPPTGKKVAVWCIANCVSLENEIYEEYVLYNTSAILKQLGYNLFEKARELAPYTDLSGLKDPSFGEPDRLPGHGKPPIIPAKTSSEFDVDDFLRRAYHEIWNWRLLNKLYSYYATNAKVHGPTDREYYGLGAFKSFILSMLAMFPDLALHIDEIYWMGNEQEGFRSNARWSMVGTHRGPGIYGEPTGKQVVIWGISQHVIKNGKIQEEWMLFNEFAVLQQLVAEA